MKKNEIESNTLCVTDNELRINVVITNHAVVQHFAAAELAGHDLIQTLEHLLVQMIQVIDQAADKSSKLDVDLTLRQLSSEVRDWAPQLSKAIELNIGSESAAVTTLKELPGQILETLGTEDSFFMKLISAELARAIARWEKENGLNSKAIAREVHEMSTADREKMTADRETFEAQALELLQSLVSTIAESKKMQEVIDKTTHKGRPYEEVCNAALSRIASLRSDIWEDTANKHGTSDRPAGDSVVTKMVNGSPKFNVVFESKAGDMTNAKWIAEAKKSKSNRDAIVFVGLARDQKSVPNNASFARLREDLLVLHFNPEEDENALALLEVVYQYALTIADGLQSGTSLASLSSIVDLVNNCADRAKSMKRKATQVQNAGSSLVDESVSLGEDLRKILELLSDLTEAPEL